MFSQEGALQRQCHRVINLASHRGREPGTITHVVMGAGGGLCALPRGLVTGLQGDACVLMTNSSMCERARKTGKSEGEAEIQSQGERREAAAKMQSIYVYCVD